MADSPFSISLGRIVRAAIARFGTSSHATHSCARCPALLHTMNRCYYYSALPPSFLPSGAHQTFHSAASSVNPKPVQRPLYFDYQATTPVDPRVLDAMLPFFVDMFGNPHSRSHAYGWEAEHFGEEARGKVADLIGALPKEIIFTSGATESNNLAIKGVAGFYGGKKRHVVTTQIEHKCVLASCRDLQEKQGWDVTYLPVGADGLVDLEEVKQRFSVTLELY